MQDKQEYVLGIHTLETCHRISRAEYQESRDRFYRYKKMHSNCTVFEVKANAEIEQPDLLILNLEDRGLNIALKNGSYTANGSNYKNYSILYRINPNQILGGNTFDIFRNEPVHTFIDVAEKVNAVIALVNTDIAGYFPYMHQMNLYRIDFCSNITCADQREVSEYIKLLKMYGGYKGFNMEYGKDRRTGKEYSHKYYTKLVKGGVTVYAYDKHHEMLSKPKVYPAGDTELACNVLRVEIQIEKTKIQNEKKRTELKNSVEFMVKAMAEVQEHFAFYFKKLFSEGDYQTYEQANKIIDNSDYTPQTREKLKKLVKHISDHNGVQNGINAMTNELQKKTGDGYNPKKTADKIDKMIDKLSDINVNIVTIPSRDNIKYLPNLLKYFYV